MNHTLSHLAATTRPATLTAARAALKGAGLVQARAPELVAEAVRLERLRTEKRVNRAAWAQVQRRPRQAPVLIPAGTPAERLAAARIRTVKAAAKSAVRIGVNDTIAVRLTDDPAAIGWTQSACTDYTTYRGKFKNWACNSWANTLTVPTTWRVRVARRGLAQIGGMVTLDAAPLDGAPAGVDLFAASWLVQGRGNKCTLAHGAIARAGIESYHGDTPELALRGLRRKIRAAQWSAHLALADLAGLVAEHGTAIIRLSDAKAVGACDYGVRSWCAAVGLDYAAGQATIAQAYAGYLSRPQPEARAAILHALRRVRVITLESTS